MNDQVDMSQFIAARSDQMNADDLMDQPRTIKITKVTAAPDAAEQPVSVHYEGDQGKPFKPCKTVRRIMVGVWGKDASKYVGRSMTLYRDEKVAFGGMQVGGIRVSHMSDISAEKTVALMVTRGRKAPFKILPLVDAPAGATGAPDDDGQEAALRSLTEAAAQGTEALANVWKQKGMAPFRDALQMDLDRLKKVAVEADTKAKPAEPETTGDLSGEKEVDATIAKLEAAPDDEAVEAIITATKPHLTFLEERLQMKLEIAFDQARNRVKVPEAAE